MSFLKEKNVLQAAVSSFQLEDCSCSEAFQRSHVCFVMPSGSVSTRGGIKSEHLVRWCLEEADGLDVSRCCARS